MVSVVPSPVSTNSIKSITLQIHIPFPSVQHTYIVLPPTPTAQHSFICAYHLSTSSTASSPTPSFMELQNPLIIACIVALYILNYSFLTALAANAPTEPKPRSVSVTGEWRDGNREDIAGIQNSVHVPTYDPWPHAYRASSGEERCF